MDSNCSFCGLSPQICKLMGKCAGIAKTHPTFAKVIEARAAMKMQKAANDNKLKEEEAAALAECAADDFAPKRSD